MGTHSDTGLHPDMMVFTSHRGASLNEVQVTVWSRNEIKKGDILQSSIFNKYDTPEKFVSGVEVVEIIERKDSRGVWENPKDKVKTHYTILGSTFMSEMVKTQAQKGLEEKAEKKRKGKAE
jgi:hypothetical protein